jgi:16S rRNA processing protein RimM
VLKTQGRRGEVAVEVHSDVPDRFYQGMKLWALEEVGSRRGLKIEELWPHKRHLVLKFAGVDSISDAETLVGCELQVPVSERATLEPGWNYVSDLIGCVLFSGDREVGTIQNVQFGAGEAPLLIVSAGSKEYEIPYAEAYLQSVDLENRRIQMLLPDGLLEVNSPLTPEEKREQAGQKREERKH